jgi:hypothetical protein
MSKPKWFYIQPYTVIGIKCRVACKLTQDYTVTCARFTCVYCLHLQGEAVDDGGSTHLWNVGQFLCDYKEHQQTTAIYHRQIKIFHRVFVSHHPNKSPLPMNVVSHALVQRQHSSSVHLLPVLAYIIDRLTGKCSQICHHFKFLRYYYQPSSAFIRSYILNTFHKSWPRCITMF